MIRLRAAHIFSFVSFQRYILENKAFIISICKNIYDKTVITISMVSALVLLCNVSVSV